MTQSLTGGCLCKKVRYEVTGEPLAELKCHCRSCQLATGSAYFPVIVVQPDTLKLSGELKTYSSPGASGAMVHRSFCPQCGTTISGHPEAYEVRTISAATLDNPEVYQPKADIWMEDAASWDACLSNTQKFDRNPG
jgi:hypothetical protein